MTDLRARLADALREHLEVFDRFTERHVCTCEKWTSDQMSEFWDHLVDVLLSLPGIAIVDVPEGAEVIVRMTRDGAIARLNRIEAEEVAANAAEQTSVGEAPR